MCARKRGIFSLPPTPPVLSISSPKLSPFTLPLPRLPLIRPSSASTSFLHPLFLLLLYLLPFTYRHLPLPTFISSHLISIHLTYKIFFIYVFIFTFLLYVSLPYFFFHLCMSFFLICSPGARNSLSLPSRFYFSYVRFLYLTHIHTHICLAFSYRLPWQVFHSATKHFSCTLPSQSQYFSKTDCFPYIFLFLASFLNFFPSPTCFETSFMACLAVVLYLSCVFFSLSLFYILFLSLFSDSFTEYFAAAFSSSSAFPYPAFSYFLSSLPLSRLSFQLFYMNSFGVASCFLSCFPLTPPWTAP